MNLTLKCVKIINVQEFDIKITKYLMSRDADNTEMLQAEVASLAQWVVHPSLVSGVTLHYTPKMCLFHKRGRNERGQMICRWSHSK